MLVEYRAGARVNLGDGDRLTIVAAVGKRAVGRGHLERRNRTGAERHDGDILDVSVGGIDAKLFDERDDLVVADGVGHLDVGGVGRYGRCLLERDVAIARVGVVLHLGRRALYRERRVAVEGDVGVHAVLNGRCQRKGLKRGAHGALGRGVVDVVLVGVVVVAAHHALNVAGLGVDNDHTHIQAVERKRIELGADGVLCHLLHRGVDGGLDGQAALKENIGGELLLQKLLNIGHKVRLRVHIDAAARNLGHVEGDGFGLSGIVLLLGDMAQAQHVVEDLVAAGERQVGVDRGVVLRRRVGKADEQRGLAQGEVSGALGQIGFGGGLDTVGAVAVVDGVEVHHKDLVLGVHLLHLDGDIGLAHLTLDGRIELLLLQDGVAHQLLGDSRCTLVATGGGRHGGARDAPQVDTAVLVEALVLNVDGALQHVGGNLVLGDGLAVLRVEARDLVAVAIDDLGGFAYQIGIGVGVVGQIGQPAVDVTDHADAKRHTRDKQKAQKREQDHGQGMRLGTTASLSLARTHISTSRYVVPGGLVGAAGAGWT